MKTKNIRKWLNKKTGMAAVELEIEDYGAFLNISDCSRKISLEFFWGAPKELEEEDKDGYNKWGYVVHPKYKAEALHKIDVLRNVLNILYDHIESQESSEVK